MSQSYNRADRYVWNPDDLVIVQNPGHEYPVASANQKQLADSVSALRADNDRHRGNLQAMLRGFFAKGYPSTNHDLKNRLQLLRDDFHAITERELQHAFYSGVAAAPKAKERYKESRNSRKALKAIANRSYKFFDQYLDDLRDDVSATTSNDFDSLMGRFENRIGMYSSGQWQAVWQGFGDALGDARGVRRVLEDGAEHCDTCPSKAKEYDSFDDMVNESGVPGDGSDDCGGNCKCYLEAV